MQIRRSAFIGTVAATSCALVLLVPQFATATGAAPGKPVSPSSAASPSSTPVPLTAGTTYSSASCGGLEIVGSQILCESMTMPMETPTAIPVATAAATASPVPTQAPTALPTAAVPTATTMPMPTSTVGAIVKNAGNFGNWSPSARDTCTKAEHDSFAVIGPDGLRYPTWHPPVLTRPNGTTCTFGHEHGDDPARSKVNSSPPPFGYAAIQMGDIEPHEGYKVVVLNPGDTNVESNLHGASAVSTIAARGVFHTGTSGVGRYTTRFHSLQMDYVGQDPPGEFHIYGMSDTGFPNNGGSTCSDPRRGAKDFSLTTCPDTYEIWNNYGFEIDTAEARATCCTGQGQSPLVANITPAVFDPITTQDPSDLTKLIYTALVKPPNIGGTLQSPSIDPTSPESWAQGCRREIYIAGGAFANAWSAALPTDYWTDPMGVIGPVGGDAVHMIHQYVSRSQGGPQEIFKTHSNHCGNGIHSPN